MAYTVLDSKNINKTKNIYTFGGSGTKPEREDIAENSKLIDYSSGQKFYYDPSKAAGSKWQPDKEPSGGSSGGEGLPADFPAEGSENANKFIGFDANGDYTAKDVPSGGGAEKFVVTITDNAGVTSNKTVAEILAAKAAGKDVVASVTSSTYLGQVIELPLMWSFANEEGSAVFFSGCAPRPGQALTEAVYSVYCLAQTGQEEVWGSDGVELGEGVPSYSSSNNDQVLGVSSGNLAWVENYAPLIVTLTAGATEGQFVGDKTYKEVYDAFMAGQNCILNSPAMLGAFAVLAVGHETDYTILTYGEISTSGSANDYITVTIGD